MPPDRVQRQLAEQVLLEFNAVDAAYHGPSENWQPRDDCYGRNESQIRHNHLLEDCQLRQWWLARIGPGEVSPSIQARLIAWGPWLREPTPEVFDTLTRIIAAPTFAPLVRVSAIKTMAAFYESRPALLGPIIPRLAQATQQFLATSVMEFHGLARELLHLIEIGRSTNSTPRAKRPSKMDQ